MVNLSILIIEDDRDVAQLYDRVLQASGYSTEIIHTGEAALARLAVAVPHLVLLDLNLPPHISGIDVLHYIRADPRLSNTRVIIVTGHLDLADSVRDEADRILLKPIDVNQLNEVVERFRPKP
jgi:CheY-like chemotaxis protein